MQNHEHKKKKKEEVKNQDSIGKKNFFPSPSTLGQFSRMVACKNTRTLWPKKELWIYPKDK
jgi:hypothetical protein